MTRGKFIVFEGGEGVGKSTQARVLAEHLESRGIAVECTREPGGTPGAEAIRALLLDPPGGSPWGARAEALLFAAARSDHVEKRILPAIESGRWVICDRFVDSSRAYQGGAGAIGDEAVLKLHEFGSRGLLPDLTILLVADRARVDKRLEKRDGAQSDAIGGRSEEYHRKVAEAFERIARQEPERYAVIDASGAVENVARKVIAAVEQRIPGP